MYMYNSKESFYIESGLYTFYGFSLWRQRRRQQHQLWLLIGRQIRKETVLFPNMRSHVLVLSKHTILF